MAPKQLILLGFMPFLLTGLRAQQAPIGQSRWSVSILAGLNIPTGKFGGKNFADSTQSFAQTGPSVSLQLNYRLHRSLGLSLLLTGQENTVNTFAMEQQIENANPDEIIDISSGTWKIGKIMAGPTWSHPIGTGRWELTVKGMAGVLKTSEPQQTFSGSKGFINPGGGLGGGGVVSTFEFYSGKQTAPWTFSWLGGAGLRFKINTRWSFLTDIDYSAASIKVPYVGSHSGFLTPIGTGPIIIGSGGTPPVLIGQPGAQPHYSLPVTSLSAHFGMEFRF
ncbi:MAG TPA: hypothetical protein VGM89_03810 [Puia sp.]|jgi:hypothetical protein